MSKRTASYLRDDDLLLTCIALDINIFILCFENVWSGTEWCFQLKVNVHFFIILVIERGIFSQAVECDFALDIELISTIKIDGLWTIFCCFLTGRSCFFWCRS